MAGCVYELNSENVRQNTYEENKSLIDNALFYQYYPHALDFHV